MNNKMICAVVLAAASVPMYSQQRTITCASQNGQSQSCPANTRDGVLLVREQSANVCQQGTTWSYTRRSIEVNGGCSAQFAVSTRGERGNRAGNGYGNSAYGNDGGNENRDGQNQNNGYNNGNRDNADGNRNNGSGFGSGSRDSAQTSQQGVTLQQGTQMSMRLDQTVRLSELNQGSIVTGSLVSDVSQNGRLIAPAGTPIQAKVASAQGAALDLRLDSFSVNGQHYVLTTNSVRGLRDAISAGDGNDSSNSRFGAVLNGLASVGTLPSGTVFNFRTTSASRPTPVQ